MVAGRKLLGIGRAADHLANGLRNSITVDTVDLQQLVGFSTARNVGHSETVQTEARLIDHC